MVKGGDPEGGYPTERTSIPTMGPTFMGGHNDDHFTRRSDGDRAGTHPNLDADVEISRMVMETFERCDEVHKEILGREGDHYRTHDDGPESDILDKFVKDAMTPLYDGCTTSKLSGTLLLLNVCNVYSVSNTFVDELLALLKEDFLPQGNHMSKSMYEAKTSIRKLGLQYNNIYVCPEGHVLFKGAYKELTHCPNCNTSRYIEGSNPVSVKVLRHFPLTSRLQRMYRCKAIAELMTWHKENMSEDGCMRSIVDSRHGSSSTPRGQNLPTNQGMSNLA